MPFTPLFSANIDRIGGVLDLIVPYWIFPYYVPLDDTWYSDTAWMALITDLDTQDSNTLNGTGGEFGVVELSFELGAPAGFHIFLNVYNAYNGMGNAFIANVLSGDGALSPQVLEGTADIDILVGSMFADSLSGLGGTDILDGGLGNDLLDGGAGDDRMAGGAGHDRYIVGSAGDVVFENAGEGTDEVWSTASHTLAAEVERLVLFGTARDGIGNSGDNRIEGNASLNLIYGMDGNDELIGNDGADRLYGGNGDDTLHGGAAFDLLEGGDGNDTYILTDRGDRIAELAGQGYDTLHLVGITSATLVANVEAAIVVAPAFASTPAVRIVGNDLDNHITGGAANDTLLGGAGADTLLGGLGNDVLIGGSGGDVLNGQGGVNTASYAGSLGNVTIELDTGVVTGGDASGDQLSGIQNLTGGDGDDVLTGNAVANVLSGGIGDDSLTGRAGNDTLIGGAGGDDLDGGDGYDILSYAGSAVAVVVSLETFTASGGDADGDQISNTFEGVTGGNGDDTITGNAGNNTLLGGAGADTISGGDGVDSISGDAGSDTLSGGNGVDMLSYYGSVSAVMVNLATLAVSGGDAAGDIIDATFEGVTGGSGHDIITGNGGNNNLIGGAGDDLLAGEGGNDTRTGGLGGDTLAGDGGHDWVSSANDTTGVQVDLDAGPGAAAPQTATGGEALGDLISGFESIIGGGGSDALFGSSGSNWLTGNAGNDSLSGRGGNDTLRGGDGNDYLDGGAGNDSLTGGAGSDTFVFADGWGIDSIVDFDVSDLERIDVSALSNITDFADLVASHARETAGVLEIFDGANVIRLSGHTLAELGVGLAISEADFVF